MSPIYLLTLSWVVAYRTAPFAGWMVTAAESPALAPTFAPASAPLAFSGEMVDGDLPATYRLPPPASLEPLSVEVTPDPLPLFLPPMSTAEVHADPTMALAAPVPVTETAPPVEAAPPIAQAPQLEPMSLCDNAPPVEVTPLAGAPPIPSDSPATVEPHLTEPNKAFAASKLFPPAGSPPGDCAEFPVNRDPRATEAVVPQTVVNAAAQLGPMTLEVLPCTTTTTNQAAQLLPAVQRGYMLAQRGALFAARTEFVQVLRRVAQAKDIAANSEEHSRALAAGLRALDEASDFVPDGVQLEAELDVQATASSHRTPALPQGGDIVSPHEAAASYHHFAQLQLGKAVAGDQAGSMALYGLGRIESQRAEQRDDDVRFVRGAMTMYAAALTACPDNHMAANELGVLECRTGRPAEAARLFERTINFAPSATAYHNLAVAQQKLGLHAHARANEQESQRLAAWERARGTLSRRAGVRWVAPDEIARIAQPAALTPPPVQAANVPAPSKSPWQRTVELAKSLPRPGSTSEKTTSQPDPAPRTHVVWPAAVPTNSRWR